MEDPFDLRRFVTAQERVYGQVLAELNAGRKETHWMWFVFPQLASLGRSPMARAFAISSLAEARAYQGHPVLGVRLRECTQAVLAQRNHSVHEIFGSPDDLKFHSCMTLFSRALDAATPRNPFREALVQYFAGEDDPRTVELLT